VRTLHVVLPAGVDDPGRPSGGNAYDRRVCDGLAAAGWDVREHPVAGTWPEPDAAAVERLARVVGAVPDGALLLADGLIACSAADVLAPVAGRLQLVVLVHMPLRGTGFRHGEAAVLSAADAVITTSGWTRDRLLEWYRLDPERVQVAQPGVAPAEVSPGTTAGGELLCVAAVTAHKGHDVLVGALAGLRDLAWRCVVVGALDREPEFVAELRSRVGETGLTDRLSFVGPMTGPDLDRCYAAADLLVLATRGETFGMVVVEALARGLAVVATRVGGLPEALGTSGAGPPGLLVPADDPVALAAALRRWLLDDALRRQLRAAARERRATLPEWASTVDQVSTALTSVATRCG